MHHLFSLNSEAEECDEDLMTLYSRVLQE